MRDLPHDRVRVRAGSHAVSAQQLQGVAGDNLKGVDGRVTAVLHEGPVDSAEKAVRAAIVPERGESGR